MARSKWIQDLEWAQPDQATRGQRTQARLLDAAAELFDEKGIAEAGVVEVAARAGCTTGAVYHHFKDKQGLLSALLRRTSEQYRATTRAAVDPTRWEGAPCIEILRGYLEFSLETGRNRPTGKGAAVEFARRDADFRAHLAELRSDLNDGLLTLVLARRDEIRHPKPQMAAKFVLDMLGSLIETRIDELLLPTYLGNQPDDAFVEEALAAASAYLQLQPE